MTQRQPGKGPFPRDDLLGPTFAEVDSYSIIVMRVSGR